MPGLKSRIFDNINYQVNLKQKIKCYDNTFYDDGKLMHLR